MSLRQLNQTFWNSKCCVDIGNGCEICNPIDPKTKLRKFSALHEHSAYHLEKIKCGCLFGMAPNTSHSPDERKCKNCKGKEFQVHVRWDSSKLNDQNNSYYKEEIENLNKEYGIIEDCDDSIENLLKNKSISFAAKEHAIRKVEIKSCTCELAIKLKEFNKTGIKYPHYQPYPHLGTFKSLRYKCDSCKNRGFTVINKSNDIFITEWLEENYIVENSTSQLLSVMDGTSQNEKINKT